MGAAKASCWRLMESPLVIRFLEDWVRLRGGDLRLREAWQVSAEQRIQAACIGLGQLGDSADVTVSRSFQQLMPGASDDEIRLGMAAHIMNATPYLWRLEMEAAADAFELPQHTFTRAALHHPSMYWSYETAHGAPDVGYMDWMLIHDVQGKGAMFVWLWNEQVTWDKNGHTSLEAAFLHYGARWPDDIPGDLKLGIGSTLKRCAFLNSPYVDSEEQGVPRHVRRDLQRRGHEVPVDSGRVRVVSLRERPKRMSGKPNEQSSREYHHRWWVQPHSRVYHRGTDHEQVAAIPRHWKGPEGAPWVQPKIYMVNR